MLADRRSISIWRITTSEQSSGGIQINFVHENILNSIRQERVALPRRIDEARSCLLKLDGVVHTRKPDRVLDTPHHHRLLVVGIGRRSPFRQALALLLVSGELWMKYDLRTARRGPPNCLGIAPSFVTDHNAKRHAIHFEEI